MLEVLALVMRSPSGFNAQPYECVVVTSEEAKKKLSKAMLGANRERWAQSSCYCKIIPHQIQVVCLKVGVEVLIPFFRAAPPLFYFLGGAQKAWSQRRMIVAVAKGLKG